MTRFGGFFYGETMFKKTSDPVWLAQRYGKEGYQFSAIEIIHHEQV